MFEELCQETDKYWKWWHIRTGFSCDSVIWEPFTEPCV